MNLFGTDGIRNRIGNYPFTSDGLTRLGKALALWAQEKYGSEASFLVASDTRYSCSWVKACLSTGLLRYPITLHNTQILPTPALYHLMKDKPQYTCGMMISASHNPADDTGIKLIDARTGKLSKKDEERICELLQNELPKTPLSLLGQEINVPHAQELYTQKILNLFKPDFLKGQKVVLDCAHGATYEVAPAIFTALGADVVAINTAPNGYNINENCGALHLERLQAAVLKEKALLGVAFDGDGDRALMVNRHGIIKDGDDILAILLTHPTYKHLPAVVGTVMANQGFEAHLARLGKKLIRSAVGDKQVTEALLLNNLTLGGEPSGHTILHNIVPTGDGILSALTVLETMLLTNNFELETFTKFPQIIVNVPIKQKKDLHQPPLAQLIEESKGQLHAGRLLVRYSGTEPLVRVMVEDSDSAQITLIAHALAQKLKTALS